MWGAFRIGARAPVVRLVDGSPAKTKNEIRSEEILNRSLTEDTLVIDDILNN